MSSQEHQPLAPANPSWVWSGVHGASGTVHPFLAWRNDPNRRYSGLGPQFEHINTILDGSGGLLLITQSPPDLAAFTEEANDSLHGMVDDLRGMGLLVAEPGEEEIETPDLDAFGREGTDNLRKILGFFQRMGLLAGAEERQRILYTPEAVQDQHWQTLMVVNPSTHESRVLPPANSMEVGLEFWSYDGVLANLLVDTESQTYRVTLTFPDCVCVYSSASNAWQCRRFVQGTSWRSHNRELLPRNPAWIMSVPHAFVKGRLFFADVVVEDAVPIMKLIEIDVEEASWRLHDWRYSLQTQSAESMDTQTPASRCHIGVLENFQIVECMGELYAVIPMSLQEYLPMSLESRRTLSEAVHEYANLGLAFMPLQFMIVNLRGDGFVHGVLRIVVPEDEIVFPDEGEDREEDNRQDILMEMLAEEPDERLFDCMAEGSVIWVALLDYVLRYDVVTGVSETEILESTCARLSLCLRDGGIPYRPSDMKP